MIATDDLTTKLRAVVRDGGLIETAQVHLFGLDEVQRAAGALWPAMRERVRTASTQIIASKLRAEDIVLPCGDGFLVIFAQAGPEEITSLCRRIREALIEFYLGEDGLAALRADVRAERIAADKVSALLAPDAARLSKPAREKHPGPMRDIGVAPIWSLRTGQIVADFFTPTLLGNAGYYVGYDPEFLIRGQHAKFDYLDTDLAILHHAIAEHDLRPASAPERAMCIQVHATTLQNRRARETYISWLPSPDDPALRNCVLTIAEIARGTPMVAIVDWVARLRPYFRLITLDFHFTDHAISAIGETGAWAASIHLPVQGSAQKPQLCERALQHVKFWTHTVHARRMRLLVHGFIDPIFLAAAADVGVDLGTGVHPADAQGALHLSPCASPCAA